MIGPEGLACLAFSSRLAGLAALLGLAIFFFQFNSDFRVQ